MAAMGTGTWQRRQRPDARYLSPGRGDALFQQHFCPLWDIVHILFIQSTISSSIKQTRQLIINRVIINICSVNERNSLRCIDQWFIIARNHLRNRHFMSAIKIALSDARNINGWGRCTYKLSIAHSLFSNWTVVVVLPEPLGPATTQRVGRFSVIG